MKSDLARLGHVKPGESISIRSGDTSSKTREAELVINIGTRYKESNVQADYYGETSRTRTRVKCLVDKQTGEIKKVVSEEQVNQEPPSGKGKFPSRFTKITKSLPYRPVSLAEETELAKSHVKGYYRKDPRTGKKIHVKPHDRKGEAKRKAAGKGRKKAAAKTKAPDVSSGKSKYPYFRDLSLGYEYPCIFHAVSIKSGWEWYGFEAQTAGDDTIYFGLVHGFETELGSFSENELRENRIPFTTNLRDLHEIMPPRGWEKVERPVPSKCPKCGSAGRKEAPIAGNYECGECGATYAKPKARAAAKAGSVLEAAKAAYRKHQKNPSAANLAVAVLAYRKLTEEEINDLKAWVWDEYVQEKL